MINPKLGVVRMLKKSLSYQVRLVASSLVVSSLAIINGCAKATTSSASSSSTLGSDVSLSSLPSISGMVKTNSSSSSARLDLSNLGRDLASSAASSGTPPILVSIDSVAEADTYFWNGLATTLSSNSHTITQDEANQFWGGVDGGVGGGGACYMAQNVGQSFSQMMQSGNSLCYMKKIPTAASGVTSTFTGVAADTFKQAAADRLVRVDVSGNPGGDDQGGGGGSNSQMKVFIKVFGSNNVTSDVYKVRLHFCGESGDPSVVDSSEEFIVNKASGVYTSVNQQNNSNGKGKNSITAALKLDSGGKLVFDPSKERAAEAHYQSDQWGSFKASIKITAQNQLISKMMNSGSYGSNNNYSVADFTGGSLSELRFLAGGFKGSYSPSGGGDAHSYSGGTEFRDTHYVSVTSSSLKTTAEAIDFSSDSFYSSLAAPSVDLSGLTCDATPDAIITMDFNNAGVQAIAQECEGDRLSGDNFRVCDSGVIQTAQGRIFDFYANQH